MSRTHFFITAIVGGLLAWQPIASAQTGSKSSSKKASATPAKKGPSSGTKKTTPTPKKSSTGARTAGEMKEADSAGPNGDSSAKATPEPTAKKERAPSATVEPQEIADFASQPEKVQSLIRDAIDLTRRNLTYTFGSADPDKGGMDCSGAIYYVLRAHGFADVARSSSGQYLWSRKRGTFFPVVSDNAESVEFEQLQPGDLMFWTGTYSTGRDVPISHVMMYLGREKKTKKRIMFGASDGRSYNGIQRWGVSVFDFRMPAATAANGEPSKVRFVGYARIPGMRVTEPSTSAAGRADASQSSEKPGATPATKSGSSAKKSKSGS